MSKYDALADYLSQQKVGRLQMSFADIERVIGGKLPASQRYPAWWSNNPHNNPMTRIWLDAGFQTEQVDIGARKLVFRRTRDEGILKNDVTPRRNVGDHPLFTRLQGTAYVPEGIDLTEPADPDWGKLAYGDQSAKGRV